MKLQIKTGMFRVVLLLTAILSTQSPVWASPLDDARAAGFVTETPNGYVVAEEKAPVSIQKLVADVNQKRKAAYQRIANKTGANVEQVAHESYQKRHAAK
jgi:uncharacterized protein YdbL (DUF1318 family)